MFRPLRDPTIVCQEHAKATNLCGNKKTPSNDPKIPISSRPYCHFSLSFFYSSDSLFFLEIPMVLYIIIYILYIKIERERERVLKPTKTTSQKHQPFTHKLKENPKKGEFFRWKGAKCQVSGFREKILPYKKPPNVSPVNGSLATSPPKRGRKGSSHIAVNVQHSRQLRGQGG